MRLGRLREQLGRMADHMKATPDPRFDGDYWADSLFSVIAPWDYDPERVEGRHRKPVFVFWVQYLEDLQDSACNLEDENLMWHYHRAIELEPEIGELLKTSREAARGYWKEVIEEWETRNTL